MSDSDSSHFDANIREWSEAMAAQMERKLRESEILLRPPAPDAAILTDYLSGALPEARARLVERSLTQAETARAELRQTRRELARLRAVSWVDVCAEADAGSEVAQAWRRLAVRQMQAQAQSPLGRTAPDWSRLNREMREGQSYALALRTRAAAFGERLAGKWRLAARQPALARGNAAHLVKRAGTWPDGAEIHGGASLDNEGTLRVSFTLRGDPETVQAIVHGPPIALSLHCEGESLPLGILALMAGKTGWEGREIGAALGLPVGPLPGSAFQLCRGEQLETSGAARTLFADIPESGADGEMGRTRTVALRIENGPQWQGGEVVLALSIDEMLRYAYQDKILALETAALAQRWQRLGTWRVRDWEAEPRLLRFACPGEGDEGEPFAAPLRALLFDEFAP